MFKSATVKLTLIYIAILLGICAFFSFNWYRVATQELDRALHRQSTVVELLPNIRGSDSVREIFEERERQLIAGKRNIARQLFAVNVLLILFGGAGSYFMAKRTLGPIEDAHQAQARFVADASHELRTPLAVMQTEIEVALRDPALNKSEAVGLLRSNLEELAKLTTLSDGLLKLARQDADGGIILEPVMLQSVLRDVQDRTARQAKTKNVSVKFDAAEVSVLAQHEGLVEVFVNLVDNAIKYSPPGSEVSVAVKKSKHQAMVYVADAGKGIEAKDLPFIFDRFYRADSSRTHQGSGTSGHGLGLSLAQHIALAHGTEIKVRTKPGKGSTFSIALQRANAFNTG